MILQSHRGEVRITDKDPDGTLHVYAPRLRWHRGLVLLWGHWLPGAGWVRGPYVEKSSAAVHYRPSRAVVPGECKRDVREAVEAALRAEAP